MGEIVEMMLEGILCEKCGCYIGKSIGYPRKCEDCKEDDVNGKQQSKKCTSK